MVIFIESVIACLLFTIIVRAIMYLNPINMIHSYPPAIQNRARKLGLITDKQKGESPVNVIRKIIAIIIFAFILAFAVYKFNGANTFLKGSRIFISVMVYSGLVGCFSNRLYMVLP